MGGSLAAACRRKFPDARIIGMSRSASALRLARRKKWAHRATRDLPSALALADLVILCTPVDTFPKLLSMIDRSAPKGTLVTDVGSVKGKCVRWAERRRFRRIFFVGAHPMAGSHARGIEHANARLYDGSVIFLTRSKKTDPAAYRRVKSFWKKISSRLVEVTPVLHDQIVSEISHLPHAVAYCLMLAVPCESLQFAANGFRDTTRVAQSAPSVWLPIFEGNRAAVLKSLRRFENTVKKFKNALGGKNTPALRKMLLQGSARRRQM